MIRAAGGHSSQSDLHSSVGVREVPMEMMIILIPGTKGDPRIVAEPAVHLALKGAVGNI